MVAGSSFGAEPSRIRVGAENNEPPLSFVDKQGQPAGFAVDLLRAMEADGRLRFEIVPNSWKYISQEFEAGRLDVLANVTIDDERRRTMEFSIGHAHLHAISFTRPDRPAINRTSQFAGKTIGMITGTIAYNAAMQNGYWGARVRLYTTWPQVLMAVKSGGCDFGVATNPLRSSQIDEMGLHKEFVDDLVFHFHMAVQRGDATTLEAINEELGNLKENGTFDRLYAKWIGPIEPHPIRFADLRPYFLPTGAVLLLLVCLLAWQEKVKNRFARQAAALKDSEERYRHLFEAEADAIIVVNFDSKQLVDANGAAINLYGYSHDEFLRLSPMELSGEPDKTERSIASQETVIPLRWHRKKDGTALPVEIHTSYFSMQGQKFIVAAIRDLTESKRAEEERKSFQRKAEDSQRLESLGVLAGGIAHDFNNILSGIYGFTSLAQQSASGNDELLGYLNEITLGARRAADLVKQILAFSRSDDAIIRRVQMRQVVSEAVRFLRATVPSTIVIETDLAENLPEVDGDPTQLHQIVMNLGTNSWHAMQDSGGRLTFRLETCVVDGSFAPVLPEVKPGLYVRLTVSDTGCGMDSETQSRAFQPFFTTKAVGDGTGLGLSVVHGVVRSHHGAIRLTSQVDVGTTFEIYLPAASTDSPPAEAVESSPVPLGRGERILVVDDEDSILRFVKLSLSRLGHKVVTQSRAREALALLESEPQGFQLVITDQTMPELTGLELAMRLRALRSDLPVILSTGYGLDITQERIKAAGIREVLKKPYTAEMLAATVHRLLGNTKSDRGGAVG